MELIEFTQIARHILEGNHMDIRFGENTEFSLPVAVRRDEKQFDAMFLYENPAEGSKKESPRPFAWVLLDACTGNVALLCRCDLVDFMSPGRYPMDCMLPMEMPKPLPLKKQTALRDKLFEAYEEIRGFVFEENLTRPQAAAVSAYKEHFRKLIYGSHYPFYHALSPAFFHWLRMPLPKEALLEPSDLQSGLQSDGYQLLILENLQQLVRQFQEKIAVDNHKERLFDQLHRELQDYKNDMLNNLTQSMELDIIQVIDAVCKSVEAFQDKDCTPENSGRLLGLLEGVETDLCDLLYRHGVEPYTLEGVDVTRQRIISTQPTADPALDKRVAAHLARGWEKAGKIIRPERISVYVYDKGEQ